MTRDTAAFWDRIARKYAAKPVADAAAYATTLARTRNYLRDTDRVLEVGAGTASTAITLAPLVADYTASDIAPEMVRIGQEKARAAGLENLTIRQGVLGDSALANQPYDAVLAFNLLHLCPDPATEAAKAHALLRPGGYFISKSACLADGFSFLRPVIGVMRLIGRAPWVGFLSRAGLEAMIREAGFEIVETGDYPAKPPAHFIVARKR
ncbi:MAG: class I SAM-dependent methyltransferase [Rhodobacteraceae bacterium]|nr:class I SAM-dependent methyltransferase [Paracoccaceae bacterium]